MIVKRRHITVHRERSGWIIVSATAREKVSKALAACKTKWLPIGSHELHDLRQMLVKQERAIMTYVTEYAPPLVI